MAKMFSYPENPKLEQELTQMSRLLDAVTTRQGKLEKRIKDLETAQGAMQATLNDHEARITALEP